MNLFIFFALLFSPLKNNHPPTTNNQPPAYYTGWYGNALYKKGEVVYVRQN